MIDRLMKQMMLLNTIISSLPGKVAFILEYLNGKMVHDFGGSVFKVESVWVVWKTLERIALKY